MQIFLIITFIYIQIYFNIGFPGGTSGKEPACQCRRYNRCVFDPWVGKIPWRRACNPLQYSCWRIPWTEKPGWLGANFFNHHFYTYTNTYEYIIHNTHIKSVADMQCCNFAIVSCIYQFDLEHLQTWHSIFHLSVTGPGARFNDQVERMIPGNVSVFPYASTK